MIYLLTKAFSEYDDDIIEMHHVHKLLVIDIVINDIDEDEYILLQLDINDEIDEIEL